MFVCCGFAAFKSHSHATPTRNFHLLNFNPSTMERTTEGVHLWLTQTFANPWSSSALAPELTDDILAHVLVLWSRYDTNSKTGLLFALLCVKKAQMAPMKERVLQVSTYTLIITWRVCVGFNVCTSGLLVRSSPPLPSNNGKKKKSLILLVILCKYVFA